MRITLIFLLGCFVTQFSSAQNPMLAAFAQPNKIQATAEAMANDPLLKNASFTFYCYDMDSGKVLAEYHPLTSLVPASTQKIVTTATALDMLGGGYRVKTLVQHDGYIDSMCVLHGNIYIKGGGDPALGGSRFKKRYKDFMWEWSEAIAQMGIDSIDGKVVGDAQVFTEEMTPATWIWGDLGNYYGAGPSGLTIYDNVLKYEFRSGPEKGDSAWLICTTPYNPNLRAENRVKAANVKKDNSYVIGGQYEDYRLIKGQIPKGEDAFVVRGTLPDPAYQAAFDLEAALFQHGVALSGRASTVRKLRIEHNHIDTAERFEITKKYSPSLTSLVHQTNMYSVNLYAEHILNFISLKRTGRGSTYSGAAAVTPYWKKKGIDVTGMYVSDGSGLSRFNAINSRQMVQILVYMRKKSKQSSNFYKSLPLAGKSGTLSRMCKGSNSFNNLRAKSGTMTRVKSYAGYVKTKSGRHLAFAMIVNNYNCSASQVAKKLEKIMNAMGDYTK